MTSPIVHRFRNISLRARLTLWYTLSLAFIMLVLIIFLYIQIRRSLIDQLDTALHIAASQTSVNVETNNGEPTFRGSQQAEAVLSRLSDDFVIILRALDGTVLDVLSSEDEVPDLANVAPGFSTHYDESEPWRVYSHAIELGDAQGWIRVAQELDPVNATLTNLRYQLLWGVPLLLLLSGIGGYFLASRALRPIDDITQTAQGITSRDMNERIDYQGPADEVGRLAHTFDMMLDRLKEGFERERRFTADAAHELRTPLTAMKGSIGVALSKPRSPDEYAGALDELENHVDRLIKLSNDLLFVSRLEQSFVPDFELINIGDLLSITAELIQPLAFSRSITVNLESRNDMFVMGEENLLMRLFLNLMDNAVKYSSPHGTVQISAIELTSMERLFVCVSVRDAGPGIAGKHLPHLIERFYRVDDDRARHDPRDGHGGSGLGLAIAFEIARVHNGKLELESEVGIGTTVIVRLPASAGAPAASPDS